MKKQAGTALVRAGLILTLAGSAGLVAWTTRTEERPLKRCSRTVRAVVVTTPESVNPPVYELREWSCYGLACEFRPVARFDDQDRLTAACEASK